MHQYMKENTARRPFSTLPCLEQNEHAPASHTYRTLHALMFDESPSLQAIGVEDFSFYIHVALSEPSRIRQRVREAGSLCRPHLVSLASTQSRPSMSPFVTMICVMGDYGCDRPHARALPSVVACLLLLPP